MPILGRFDSEHRVSPIHRRVIGAMLTLVAPTPTSPRKRARTPAHIRALRTVDSFGAKKQKILEAAFPTPQSLTQATEEDFAALKGIGTRVARNLAAALRGEAVNEIFAKDCLLYTSPSPRDS